jgi:8-oxo-dGTP diphosphatase
VRLRHSVRALILDEQDRLLLYHFLVPGAIVWAAPGGGIEAGESPLDALRRELHEEVGLTLAQEPPHVWHQEAVGDDLYDGYDGVINDYFLVRTPAFIPAGTLTPEEMAAENIRGFRWWPPAEIAAYPGPDLFSPRDLATPPAGRAHPSAGGPALVGFLKPPEVRGQPSPRLPRRPRCRPDPVSPAAG